MARVFVPHSSHWGAFEAEVADGTVVAIHPYRHDPDPSPLLGNIVDSLRHRARITQPMIRSGWLDRGPGGDSRRGAEAFVPVSWTTALDRLCALLAEGREVSLADLPARARSLVELGALRARAAQDCARLGLKELAR